MLGYFSKYFDFFIFLLLICRFSFFLDFSLICFSFVFCVCARACLVAFGVIYLLPVRICRKEVLVVRMSLQKFREKLLKQGN
jgi:hypothetical protein